MTSSIEIPATSKASTSSSGTCDPCPSLPPSLYAPAGPILDAIASGLSGCMPVVRKPAMMFSLVRALRSALDTHDAKISFRTARPLLCSVQTSLYTRKAVLNGLNTETSSGCIAWLQ